MLIISHKSKKAFKDFLKENSIDYIETIDNPRLDKRVSDHPDLSIFPLGHKKILVDKALASYYRQRLKGYKIIEGESVGGTYPKDAIYNVYEGEDFYIHNNHTEKHILGQLKAKTHLFVNQGYSRCSIIPMKERILTSDYGIYKALRGKIKVILLEEESIDLDGFAKGFLGGTCGLYGSKLIFNGSIKRLKSYDLIRDNAKKEKLDLIYPDINLLDTGSHIKV
ncbi:MAG: hypothetical protein Q4D88_06610 [Anaerococcus sp.]|nr:hypothetical protein [Anaerococcus sp.]